jgi:hypothetical protein
MKARNIGAIIIMLGFLIVSCDQYPIFFTIANETKPLKPRIQGHPTNMVVFERYGTPILCVASGRLYWYANGQWDSPAYHIPQPSGNISALAVAEGANGVKRLYVLGHDSQGVNAQLQYIEANGSGWIPISSGTFQTIYADPEKPLLFLGSGINAYDIHYVDTANTLRHLKTGTSLLSGAVFLNGTYYLSTEGSGIFSISEADINANTLTVLQLDDKSAVEQNINRKFLNMIKLEDNNTIIAVERGGEGNPVRGGALYEISSDPGSFARMYYTIPGNTNQIEAGNYATGALALWKKIDEKGDTIQRLLVAGKLDTLYPNASSSFTNGYVEFDIKDDGSFDTDYVRHDSENGQLQTADTPQYIASIGKLPINHLFQAPGNIDPNMTFFASTQKSGLWSYRYRDGRWQWNAEE